MNPYAVFPIIGGIGLCSLGFTSLLAGKRDKVNYVFAAFCFSLGISGFTSFFLHNASTLEAAVRWTKVPWAFGIPAIVFTLIYAFVLTDLYKRFSKKMGWIDLKVLMGILIVSSLIAEIFLLTTDLVISGAAYYEPQALNTPMVLFFCPLP